MNTQKMVTARRAFALAVLVAASAAVTNSARAQSSEEKRPVKHLVTNRSRLGTQAQSQRNRTY